jgi:hypothetical protein
MGSGVCLWAFSLAAIAVIFSGETQVNAVKPSPAKPTPDSTRCSKALADCHRSPNVLQCEAKHGCHHRQGVEEEEEEGRGGGSTEKCMAAALACKDELNDCLRVVGPSGCAIESSSSSPKHPVPAHHGSGYSPECIHVISGCASSPSYKDCIVSAGCVDMDGKRADVCSKAERLCEVVLMDCVSDSGIASCYTMINSS